MYSFMNGLGKIAWGEFKTVWTNRQQVPQDMSSTIFWDRDILLGTVNLQREYDKHSETLHELWTSKPMDIASKRQVGPQMEEALAILRALGFAAFAAITTQEHAYDVLGLIQAPDLDQMEALSFFKVPLQAINRTVASLTLNGLFQDVINAQAWADRKVTEIQHAAALLLGVNLPANQTADDAERLLNAALDQLEPDAHERQHVLELKEVVEWYLRPDVCAEFDLVPPTVTEAIAVYFHLKERQVDPFEVYLAPRKHLVRCRRSGC